MKSILSILLFATLYFSAKSQDMIYGKVLDASTLNPLAYVNIGIKGKELGTTSNLEGVFKLNITTNHLNDSITFSYVGYKEKSFLINELLGLKEITIPLYPAITSLQEVIVNANDKWKIENQGVSKYFGAQFSYEHSAGKNDNMEEVGQKLNLGDEQVKVLSFNIFLANNIVDSATFRINFYDFSEQQPGERVFTREIIIRQAITKGWLSVNLEAYNIWLKGSILSSIEFLRSSEKGKAFSPWYGGVAFSNKGISYHRSTSLGKWSMEDESFSIYLRIKRRVNKSR